MSSFSDVIARSRYGGDARGLAGLAASGERRGGLRSPESAQHEATARAQLLAEGVRADPALLPAVALAASELRERAGIDEPVEVYVFDQASINAFVTRGRKNVIVGLSSGAVNGLSLRELEFVIGHELGHLAFGHVDVDTPSLLKQADTSAKAGMSLRAWQRASEISADRAGLICCGSLAVATSAFFKTLSGVKVEEGSIDPRAFAAQWHELEKEIVDIGGEDNWQITHPFPPLRMQAMLLYWDALAARATTGQPVDTAPPPEVEAAVDRLLAMMDPLARETAQASDPVLVDFLLWGGLVLALADGHLHDAELARLRAILPPARVDAAVAAAGGSLASCLDQFRGVLKKRHGKLKAMEIHRILEGLMQVIHADGTVEAKEVQAFKRIGELLGVGERACELLLARFKAEGGSHAGQGTDRGA